MRTEISSAKRIVFKIGSSTILDEKGLFSRKIIKTLVEFWADLHRAGKDVILVSSGAVALGWPAMGLPARPKRMMEKQAAAAVGQCKLMSVYDDLFAEENISVAQVLLTRDDIKDRRRYLNARNTLSVLLDHHVVPIINENDTVAVEELRFGENDTLASMVGGLIDADLVFILSDVPGLYTGDPHKDKSAQLIPRIEEITPEMTAMAGGVGSAFGSGGMKTKLDAAKIAMQSGASLVIAEGKNVPVLRQIMNGGDGGSLFAAKNHSLNKRKRWIAYGSELSGCVTVDNGAAQAILEGGKSLLPVGIIKVEGNFDRGAVISIKDSSGKEIARGITGFTSQAINKVKGCHSDKIPQILGDEFEDYNEVIHRNNLALE